MGMTVNRTDRARMPARGYQLTIPTQDSLVHRPSRLYAIPTTWDNLHFGA